jgi:hypothetical protein
MSRKSRILTVATALSCVILTAHATEPTPDLRTATYLTWQRDPATTMTVHWHSVGTTDGGAARCRPADDDNAAWQTTVGTTVEMPRDPDTRIHTAEFTGLKPDSLYELQIVGDDEVFRFRTMPATLSRPIRFAVGGDMYKQDKVMEVMCRRVGEREVDFMIFGGDICNASGLLSNAPRWGKFFEIVEQNTAGHGNRLIPIIPTIGNHEVQNGGFNQTAAEAPFFYSLFAFPGEPGYGAMDFGGYLSVICLDSQHTNPVEGEQSDWLTDALDERRDVPHVLAVYHVPAWPSARNPRNLQSRRVREAWVPIFEAHGLDFAFEHHDHAYKRTHPIRDGKIDATGPVYFGDGGFAQGETRVPKSPGHWLTGGRWYLSASGSANHFHLVTIDGRTRRFEAIDASGHAFDSYNMTAGIPNTIINNPALHSNRMLIWIGIAITLSLLGITLGLIDRHRKVFHGPKKQALAMARKIKGMEPDA